MFYVKESLDTKKGKSINEEPPGWDLDEPRGPYNAGNPGDTPEVRRVSRWPRD